MPDPKKYYKLPPYPYARRQGESDNEYWSRIGQLDAIKPVYPEFMFVGGGPARQTINLSKRAPTLLQKVGREAGKYIVPVLNYAPEAYSVLSDAFDFQDGGKVDPEMMYREKYNTELTPKERESFMNWVAKESVRQRRDIMMDMGAYDLQGFWKSGDYKNMDQDNHGSDKWKKPNHPTFSNQSIYHNADGQAGGVWKANGGYQPSAHTLGLYNPEYYDWLFGSEPHRPEHLDLSRSTYVPRPSISPSTFNFKKGGLMKDTDPKKYKKTVTNMPKTPVDSGLAQSIIRGGFNTLLPPNASQMLANTITGDTRYGFEDMDPAMRFHVMRSVKNAIERTGENRGGTSYVDYSPEINKDIRDLSADLPAMVGGSYLSPEFQAATTMGRVSYDFDPETRTYTLYDSYDFSPIREDYDPGTVYGDVRKALGRNANQGSPQVIGRFTDKDYESMVPQYDKGYYREALDNPLVKRAQGLIGLGKYFLSGQGPSALPIDFKKGGVMKKEMIKRADGSYSQRGLWDNIRENAGSGRKPTKQMLKQEQDLRNPKKTKKYFVGGALNAVGDKLISGDELDAKSIGRAALGGALKSMGSPMGMMGPMSAMMPKAKKGMKVSRFDKLKGKIMESGKNEDAAAAIAAAIGRKKYGKTKFQQMAAAGRRKSK